LAAVVLAAWGLLLPLGAVAAADGDGPRSITLLHTNDLHARLLPDDRQRGGFATLAAVIRRECAASAGCLVLDAGDMVQGTPVSSLFRGVPVFELAGLLGLDASTLGNHEFDYGWESIARFRETAPFPILSANVVDAEGNLLADHASTVLEVNGVRVGIMGALTERLPDLTTADKTGPWRALPVVETVQRHLPGLQAVSDLVVVLGHLTADEEQALVEGVETLPVVISGHPHRGMERPTVVEGRIVVRVQSYGRQLGRLDLKVDVAADRVVDWSWKAIDIHARRIEPDPDVERSVQLWESRVSDVVDVPIGRSRRRYSHDETRELVERALRESSAADLAYVNRGGIRDGIPRGELLARHVWNVMPFDNHLVVGRFAGHELPHFLLEERGLDREGTYTLATLDFVARRWKEQGLADLSSAETGPLVRDVIIGWIRERGVLP
jgi:2',3'-cyclic-nucleotide 2'-phosphodiesterase (5'-nucleotidase family)